MVNADESNYMPKSIYSSDIHQFCLPMLWQDWRWMDQISRIYLNSTQTSRNWFVSWTISWDMNFNKLLSELREEIDSLPKLLMSASVELSNRSQFRLRQTGRWQMAPNIMSICAKREDEFMQAISPAYLSGFVTLNSGLSPMWKTLLSSPDGFHLGWLVRRILYIEGMRAEFDGVEHSSRLNGEIPLGSP